MLKSWKHKEHSKQIGVGKIRAWHIHFPNWSRWQIETVGMPLQDILEERKMNQLVPRVGVNDKSCMLDYDFIITAYARYPLVKFDLVTDIFANRPHKRPLS